MPRYRANLKFGPWSSGEVFESTDPWHATLANEGRILSRVDEGTTTTVTAPKPATPEPASAPTPAPSEKPAPAAVSEQQALAVDDSSS